MAELKRTNPGAAAATAVPVRHAAGNADVVAAAGQRAAQRRAQSAHDMGNAIARLGGAVEQFAAGRAAGYAADAKAEYQLMRDAQDLSLARKQSEVRAQSIRRSGERRKEAKAARRQAKEDKIRKAQEQLEKSNFAADRRAVMNAGAAQFGILEKSEDVQKIINSSDSDEDAYAKLYRLASNTANDVVVASCIPVGKEGSNGIGVRDGELHRQELVRSVFTTYAPRLWERVMTSRVETRINRHIGMVGENLIASANVLMSNTEMSAEKVRESLVKSAGEQLEGYMKKEEVDKLADTVWKASIADAYGKECDVAFSDAAMAMREKYAAASASGTVDDEFAMNNVYAQSDAALRDFYLKGTGEERGLHKYFSEEDREKMYKAASARLGKERDAINAQTNKEQLEEAVNFINMSPNDMATRNALSFSQKTMNLYGQFFAGSVYGDAEAGARVVSELKGVASKAPNLTDGEERELLTLLKNDLYFTDMRTEKGRAHAARLLSAARLLKPQRFDEFRAAFAASLNDAAQNKSGASDKDTLEAELRKNGITGKADIVALLPDVRRAYKTNPSQFSSLVRSICDEWKMREAQAKQDSAFEDMVFNMSNTRDAEDFIGLRSAIYER